MSGEASLAINIFRQYRVLINIVSSTGADIPGCTNPILASSKEVPVHNEVTSVRHSAAYRNWPKFATFPSSQKRRRRSEGSCDWQLSCNPNSGSRERRKVCLSTLRNEINVQLYVVSHRIYDGYFNLWGLPSLNGR